MKAKALLFDEGKIGFKDLDFGVSEGEVLISVEYSGVNYKDALGVTNTAPIFKTNPIVPGIDLAGEVIETKSKKFNKGQKVLVNGMGLGENINGGFSKLAVVSESIVVPLPTNLSTKEAMAYGTAGFTAGLAVYRMIQNGQDPNKGPILVSGATGGVGGFAVQIFKLLDYDVEVVTHRKKDFETDLKALGAKKIHQYEELFKEKSRPLEKARFGGVIDNLGGEFLEEVLPLVNLWGNVASIGLAKGTRFKTSVMPFILRGVSLLGASSNNCDMSVRKEVWELLAGDWKVEHLLSLVKEEIGLEEIPVYSKGLIEHEKSGRALVKI